MKKSARNSSGITPAAVAKAGEPSFRYRSFPVIAPESFLASVPGRRSPKFRAYFASWLLGDKFGASPAPIKPIRACLSLMNEAQWAKLHKKCAIADIADQIKLINGMIKRRGKKPEIANAFRYSNTYQVSSPADVKMANRQGYRRVTPWRSVPLAWVEECYRTQFPSASKRVAQRLYARQRGDDLIKKCVKKYPALTEGESRLDILALALLGAKTGLSPEEAVQLKTLRKAPKDFREGRLDRVRFSRLTRTRIYEASLVGVLARLHKADPKALRIFLSRYIAAQIESQMRRGQFESEEKLLASAICRKRTRQKKDTSTLVRWLCQQEEILRLLCCLFVRSPKGLTHFLKAFVKRQDSLQRDSSFQFLKQMGPGWDQIVGALEKKGCRDSFEQICDLAIAAAPRPISFAAGKKLLQRAGLKRRERGKTR